MEKEDKMAYDILRFINHIEKFTDEDIYKSVESINDYLKKEHLYNIEHKFLILVIKTIKNLELKKDLIEKYLYNDFLYGTRYNWKTIMEAIDNLSEENMITLLKELFLNYKFDEVTKILNIPSNLKFGIELEYYNLSFKNIKYLFQSKKIDKIMKSLSIPNDLAKKIINNSDFEKENEFDKWIFSNERDDDMAPEASSPIMTNTLNDLNQLKSICMLFKVLGADLNGGTGLHINIGVDYFNGKIDALKYLLIIWSECEEIFFKISNKENDEIRIVANNMAYPIKANIQKTFEENSDFVLRKKEDYTRFMYNIQARDRLESLLGWLHGDLESELMDAHTEDEKYDIFKRYLKEKSDKETDIRYTSVNFNHMTWNKKDKGRIEFRLFNSTLDFEVLMQNLLLIGKLFQTSLELASNYKEKCEKFVKLLNHDVTEEEKLDLLLNLLFDNNEEKEIFKKRYISVKDSKSYKNFYVGSPTFTPNEKVLCLKSKN